MPLLKLNPSWGSKTRILSETLLDFWDFEQLGIKTIWEKYEIKGQGVNVFVLDTGIDSTNLSFSNHNITAKSFVDNETPEDVHGHGTWCCGKINADKVGIAPDCHLFSAKVMDASGYGSDSDINKALTWALENNPHIVSMSLGGYNLDKEQEKLCAKIFEKGGIVLAAAGNEGTDEKTYPAAFKNVLAITAIDQDKNKADFNNYGQHVAVAAPGVACYSTILNNQFRKMSGTSMATPVTAGLIALGISYILKKKQKYGIHERDLIIQALEKSAVDLGAPGFDIYYGFGGINGLGFMEHIDQDQFQGVFDTLAADRYGIPSVAIGGSRLSKYQIELLLPYKDNAIVCLDGDIAGKYGMELVNGLFDTFKLPPDYDVDDILKEDPSYAGILHTRLCK